MKSKLILILFLIWACKNSSEQKANDATSQTLIFEQLSDKYYPFSEGLNHDTGGWAIDTAQKINIKADAETDFFIEPGLPLYEKANAPLLLMPVDNTQSFTFSVKTTPEHKVKYDASMAFIYVDSTNWLKFAFETDERLHKRLVTVKTKNHSDDNNHDAVKSNSIYLKISSDTKVVGFYYSIDGQDWQLVRVFKNEYPAIFRLGIGTQSPAGKGNQSVFENIQFSKQAVQDFRMGV